MEGTTTLFPFDADDMYAPYAIVISPEAHVMLIVPTAPPLTLASLQAELTGYQQATQPICDRLNELRDSYREALRDIAAGRKQPDVFPLWDATVGRDGKPLGFMGVFSRLNKCADRLGMTKLSYGYRMPL